VVKVIWQKCRSTATQDGWIVFTRWRRCVPLSNTCFHGITQVHTPNGILIGSAVLAGLTIMTDRQTTLLRL